MTDYKKLADALWWCTSGGTYSHCEGCQYKLVKPEKYCLEEIMKDAAAAIEELKAEVKRLNMRCADCEYASKPWPELEEVQE